MWVLRKIEGDQAAFTLITLWDSMDAVRRFAGDDVNRAVYYPQDDDYLLWREPNVDHYEVIETL